MIIYVVLDATLRLRVAESVKKVENDEKIGDKNGEVQHFP